MKCEDMNKNKTLAIKIIKNVKKYRDAAKLEINVLKKLSNYDPDCNFKCVQMYDWFDYHGHKCIAFQLLGNACTIITNDAIFRTVNVSIKHVVLF